MNPSPRAAALSLIAAGAVGLAACGHSAPTRYLTLAAVPPAAPAPGVAGLALRPPGVRWPAALDRLEVMRPDGDVRLQADEASRWSAAPGDLAAAALTEDLQARLPGLTLVGAGAGGEALDLGVEVLALAKTVEGYRLTAVVTLSGGGRAPHSRFLSLTTPEGGQDAAAEAQALSRLVGRLADAIAADLAALKPAVSVPDTSPHPGL